MWPKIWTWAKAKPLLAAIIAVCAIVALGSAYGGVQDWFAKRAEIKELKRAVEVEKKENEQQRVAWQNAMSVKDTEYTRISRDRDALRSKIARLQAAQAQPWVGPATDNELLTRFKVMGY